MSFLVIDRLSKSFGDQPVLREVSLAVEQGEALVLLGPSGSGKTTLLRLLAGFESADRGSLAVGGREITQLPPARRNFGMVFQHYALFPHLTVEENVAFGLEARKLPSADRRRRVAELLEQVDLAGFQSRRVDQISGGQQQRVALARALAPGPQVLLLDEPLSNLDPALRERTRRELRAAIGRIGITAVWVTHEQEEAFDAGDRVAVLNEGRLEQVGPPERLYLEPASRFVAFFVGRASSIPARLTEEGRARIECEGREILWRGSAAGECAPGTQVELVVRPEGLRLAPIETAGGLPGQVVRRRYAGSVTFYRVRTEAGAELEVAGGVREARVGDRVAVLPVPEAHPARIFPASSPSRSAP